MLTSPLKSPLWTRKKPFLLVSSRLFFIRFEIKNGKFTWWCGFSSVWIGGGVCRCRSWERHCPKLAVVRPSTRNLISRRQGTNERRVGTANIEQRKVITMRKTPEHSPLKGKRIEAALIGGAGNNARVGLELILYERVASLRRWLGTTTGNFIGRRQWAKWGRFGRGFQVVVLGHCQRWFCQPTEFLPTDF